MSEQSTGAEGGTPPSDPPKAPTKPTQYMLLWAPKPEDGEPRKWREIGFYEAYNAGAAEAKAREDQESGHYGAMLDAGRQRGIYLKAVAQRSWPDEEPQLQTVQQPPPEWAIGGQKVEEA